MKEITVGILQPSYLPWIGYFDYIDRCDVFVFYDDVAISDAKDWRSRNRLKTIKGVGWLSVPIKSHHGMLINQVEIDNHSNWREKHLRTISTNYSRSKFFGDRKLQALLISMYLSNWDKIANIDIHTICFICGILGINSMCGISSRMYVGGNKSERLLNTCKSLGATKYLATNASKDYLDESIFEKEGIKVEYQNYNHPEYPQLYGDFISHLSVIDLLCNCGPGSLDIIRKGRNDEKTGS